MNARLSDFYIMEINQDTHQLVLEDPDLSLQIEIPLKQTKLSSARLIGPYELEIHYEDGSAMAIRFLI